MLADDADLPLLAHDDPALAATRFHEVVDDLASRSWLVRSDLGYLVLGREQGMALLKDRRLSFPAVELLELQGLTDGIVYDGTTKGLMAQSGQAHARLRRLVSAAFTPRQVERLRPRLRAYLAGLWQDIAPAGRCEAVTALARPLPSMAIAELLGVPGDAALLAWWSASLQAVFDMDMTAKRAEIESAHEEVRDYVLDLVAGAAAAAGRGSVSALVHHEQDGDRLSEDEIVSADVLGHRWRHRHHRVAAGPRPAAVRRSSRPVGAARGRPGPGRAGLPGSAPFRADRAVHSQAGAGGAGARRDRLPGQDGPVRLRGHREP